MPVSLSCKKLFLRWVTENAISSYPRIHTFDVHSLFLQPISYWYGAKNSIAIDNGLLIVDNEQTSCR
jgi:hypothetical protein